MLANGVVYFGSENGGVYAVGAGMGRPAWPSPYFSHTSGKVDSSPIQSPDSKTVYIASSDGHVYALQAGTGTLSWEYPARNDPGLGPFKAQASLSSQGDIVYVGSDDGHVLALSTSAHPAHRLLWTHQTAAGVDAQPTVWQGNVYVASGDFLYAWTAGSGTKLWNPVRLTNTVGGYDGPVVANGIVYLASGTELYAFDATSGMRLWHRTIGQALSPPVVNNGNVYVGTRRGVYALTSSGSRVT